MLFQFLWVKLFHGYLRIPTSDQALAMSVHGTPVAWHLRWESLILAFFELILSISIMGHRIIAVLPHRRLQCSAQYVSASVFNHHRGVLQPLLLLFQGACSSISSSIRHFFGT